MIPYRFSYLLTDAVFFFLWVALYLWRKDIRKEMVVISGLFGFIAIAGESFMVNDWWSPQTITNTTIGIEDFLFGFTVGGIASVVYEEVFQKKLRKKAINARNLQQGANIARNTIFWFLMSQVMGKTPLLNMLWPYFCRYQDVYLNQLIELGQIALLQKG